MKTRTFHTLEELQAFLRNRGGHAHVTVLHDITCSPSRCTCRPWYRVSDLTAENFAEGERAQTAWIKQTSN